MPSVENDLTTTRLCSEEGRRPRAYNDATGKTVTCLPAGNLSIAIGINLETGLDDEEIRFLTSHRLGLVETKLAVYQWYLGLDAPRRSVCLDIAYNQGLGGLLHYPHMIACLVASDWLGAQAQCTAQDPRLGDRYKALGEILLKG